MIIGQLAYTTFLLNLFQNLLTNRLRETFPKLISPLQNPFIPNKDIHDIYSLLIKSFLTFMKKGKNLGT